MTTVETSLFYSNKLTYTLGLDMNALYIMLDTVHFLFLFHFLGHHQCLCNSSHSKCTS